MHALNNFGMLGMPCRGCFRPFRCRTYHIASRHGRLPWACDLRHASQRSAHLRGITAAAGKAEELGPPVLSPVSSDQQLDIEEAWLADMIQAWQDEEWQPQDNHRELGIAVGKAYRRVRATGENDLGTILLSIATHLEAFDFHDTFTGNFEVANKAIELLMSNDGQEVCCTDEADAQRLERLGTAKSRQAAAS